MTAAASASASAIVASAVTTAASAAAVSTASVATVSAGGTSVSPAGSDDTTVTVTRECPKNPRHGNSGEEPDPLLFQARSAAYADRQVSVRHQ